MGFVCFVQLVSLWHFVQFHYAITESIAQWKLWETAETVGDIIYYVSEMCRKR